MLAWSGLAHMVYPGAVHSRFEHSLGVYWLAGEAVSKLKANQVRDCTKLNSYDFVMYWMEKSLRGYECFREWSLGLTVLISKL